MTRADIKAAFDAAEAALAIDPFYSRAHTAMAYAYLYRVLLGQADDPKQTLEKARVEAVKAIEADRNDYWGYGALGGAEIWMGHHERAQSALVYCTKVVRQAAASFMRPDPWPVAGRP